MAQVQACQNKERQKIIAAVNNKLCHMHQNWCSWYGHELKREVKKLGRFQRFQMRRKSRTSQSSKYFGKEDKSETSKSSVDSATQNTQIKTLFQCKEQESEYLLIDSSICQHEKQWAKVKQYDTTCYLIAYHFPFLFIIVSIQKLCFVRRQIHRSLQKWKQKVDWLFDQSTNSQINWSPDR